MARGTGSVPTIGYRVLESLGCNKTEVLAAARDKYCEDIDTFSRPAADGNKEVEKRHGNIAALFAELVSHNNEETEDDGLISEDTCVHFRDDRLDEVKQVLDERIVEVVQNGLSKTVEKHLRNVIKKHISAFRLRLWSGGLAKFTPTKIWLDDTKIPVKVKARKCPPEQRKSLRNHLSRLLFLDFIKACLQAS